MICSSPYTGNPPIRTTWFTIFSAHSARFKSGVVIGFYLRALRICSPPFLQDELDYIVKTFLRLKFPLAMLRGGELGGLRVREHPLSEKVHPLIAKSTLSKQKKMVIKHHLKPISNKDIVIKT